MNWSEIAVWLLMIAVVVFLGYTAWTKIRSRHKPTSPPPPAPSIETERPSKGRLKGLSEWFKNVEFGKILDGTLKLAVLAIAVIAASWLWTSWQRSIEQTAAFTVSTVPAAASAPTERIVTIGRDWTEISVPLGWTLRNERLATVAYEAWDNPSSDPLQKRKIREYPRELKPLRPRTYSLERVRLRITDPDATITSLQVKLRFEPGVSPLPQEASSEPEPQKELELLPSRPIVPPDAEPAPLPSRPIAPPPPSFRYRSRATS
jgi:hypothetical protein